jgi:SnoaL-like protein
MDAREFVDRFEEGWREARGVEAFLAHFLPLMDEQVRLVQPLSADHVGHEQVAQAFRGIFGLIPDLHGTVTGFTVEGDVAHIDLTLQGSIHGRPVTVDTVDRVTVRGGKLVERVAVFDPLPLFAALATRPRAWPQAARLLLGGRRQEPARMSTVVPLSTRKAT